MMKKYFMLTFAAIVFLVIFTMFYEHFPFIDTKPDIILIIVTYIALTSDKTIDLFLAFSLGYLADLFSGSTIGLFTLLRTITYMFIRAFNVSYFSNNIVFFGILTFIVSMLDAIYLGYRFSLAGGFLSIFFNAIYMSFINLIAAFAVYPILQKIEKLYRKTKLETEEMY